VKKVSLSPRNNSQGNPIVRFEIVDRSSNNAERRLFPRKAAQATVVSRALES